VVALRPSQHVLSLVPRRCTCDSEVTLAPKCLGWERESKLETGKQGNRGCLICVFGSAWRTKDPFECFQPASRP
jgi:hypothetical protein